MTMNEIINELETMYLGDKRVNERAKQILRSVYENVGNGLSSSFTGSHEIKAAYRFFDNNLVNPEKILESHYAKTLERIRMFKIVGLIQDSAEIDMKHMESVENLGVLNDTKRPGCVLHPVIACTPEKLCLGIVSAQFITRNPDELGKKGSNNARKIEDKESYCWIQGYRVACEIAEKCPETLCVSIGDRESDIFELMMEATKGKAKLIIRAWHDRCVLAAPSENSSKLIDENKKLAEENKSLAQINKKIRHRKHCVNELKANSAQIKENNKLMKSNRDAIRQDELIVNKFKYQLNKGPVIGQTEFTLPEAKGRKSRLVKQTVKATSVTLLPSEHKTKLPAVKMNALLLEEIEVPEGEEPISWMFLTTLPISTLEEIQLIISLYLSRWAIELFFKIIKSGCMIEKLRFKEASRLFACIAIYMIVAWRVLYATFIGRTCPELPCSVIFEIDEWQSVYAVIRKTQPPDKPPDLGEFMIMIATLGGYRGRKSDGPPGMKVIWIGIQAMHKLAEGWQAYRDFGWRR